jgi:hypothetical protein
MQWRAVALLLLVSLAAILLLPAPAQTCPFCVDERGPTLAEEFNDCSLVIYGSLTNAKLDQKGGIDSGTTDLVIEKVLKSDDIIKGKKVITLAKYMPTASKSKWVIFCDVFKNEINPYRGEEVAAGSPMIEYLTGSLAIKDEPIEKRLRHCFDYLSCSDINVALDAYRVFAKADYAQYKEMAKKLPADTVAGWLKDPKTPASRLGLYGSFLGHCGDPKKHGELLRSMIEDPRKRMGSGVDGMLAGFVMLQPKEGLAWMKNVLKNDAGLENDEEKFHIRYATLKTLRFYWNNRQDILDREKILDAMGVALQVPNLSDFAIDDLRSWKAWEMNDQVLDLFGKESHNSVVIRRAILRFAICSPKDRAKTFVAEQRKRNPTWVEDTEEMLRFDTPAPKVVPTKK